MGDSVQPSDSHKSSVDNEIDGEGIKLDKSSSLPSYSEALDALSSIITPRTRADETGNNFPIMYEYLKILNLEEAVSELKVIHVAGTKGKGSTCTFVESILRTCGFRTGLYTSPHLIHLCERYRLDGADISEEKFLTYFWWCWDRLKENRMEDVHFFRFLTLLAFKIFTEEKVDVLILEVGLGGKFDATNVVKSPVVCGISSLGYDHMEILGNTLTQISQEKAGIMKPGVPAFTVPQPEEAMAVLKDTASELSIPLQIASPLDPARLGGMGLGLAGNHQYINAGLAVSLCSSWLKRTGHSEDFDLKAICEGYLPDSFVKGLVTANIPGRAQVITDIFVKRQEQCNIEETEDASSSELIFYLDGAHTPESMEACANWFSSAIARDRQSPGQAQGIFKETQNGFLDGISNFDYQQQGLGSSNISSKQVVLFNCLSERNPQLLLSQLVNTCALHGVHFHKALFVPCHSAFTQFRSTTTSTVTDLSWQLFLRKTWEILIHGLRDNNQKEESSLLSMPPPCEFLLGKPSQDNCPNTKDHVASVVLPSVPIAIKWLRECVRQSHSLRLEVLVTGSLHLIGDVLRTLKKRPSITSAVW